MSKKKKKTAKKASASRRGTRKAKAVRKKVAPKKRAAPKRAAAAKKKAAAPKRRAAAKKAAPKKAARRARPAPGRRRVHRTDGGDILSAADTRGLGAEAGGQAGDTEGISRAELADSESVEELLEEGQAFEAGIVSGVENAPPAGRRGIRTRQVPEDDVPEEYIDKD